jgi:hypothetical protein
VTLADLGHATQPSRDAHFITIAVTRALAKRDYSVPVESMPTHSIALTGTHPARN